MLDYIINLDKSLFTLINSRWTHPWADVFFVFITDLHKTPMFKLIVVPLLLAIFIWRRGLKKGLIIFVFCALSLGLSDGVGNWAIKKNVRRLRPPETQGMAVQVRSPFGGYSFVSNHSTNMFAVSTFISEFFPQARWPLYFVSLLVAYSRVYNGVHFPTDVICGAIVGMLCGYFCSRLCRWTLDRVDAAQKVES